jgi:hypothetical protein
MLRVEEISEVVVVVVEHIVVVVIQQHAVHFDGKRQNRRIQSPKVKLIFQVLREYSAGHQ